jgi:hypothetical protein
LDILDDVRDFPSRYLLILMNGQVYAKWSSLPQDEIGVWALESAENVGFAQPP